MRARHRVLGLLTVVGLALCAAPSSHAKPRPKLPGTHLPGPKPGKRKPKQPKSKGTFWLKGRLASIFTEKNGDIVNVAIDVGGHTRDIRTVDGCGLNIKQIPHLVAGLDDDRRVSVQSVNGCIGRINVGMKP